jgi:hypothetical protein
VDIVEKGHRRRVIPVIRADATAHALHRGAYREVTIVAGDIEQAAAGVA